MWGSSKEKDLGEKNKQIQILNEILQMNSKQAIEQKSLIDKLQKVSPIFLKKYECPRRQNLIGWAVISE